MIRKIPPYLVGCFAELLLRNAIMASQTLPPIFAPAIAKIGHQSAGQSHNEFMPCLVRILEFFKLQNGRRVDIICDFVYMDHVNARDMVAVFSEEGKISPR